MTMNDMKKLAAKLLRHQRGMRSYSIMHPERDWMIGVAATIIFIILIATWSAVVYQRNRSAINEDYQIEGETPVVYRASMVKDALAIFSEREAVVAQIVGEVKSLPEEIATTTEDTGATSTATTTESVKDIAESESEVPPEEVPILAN